jgi:NAD(P)-dependent dehydrogenase (short-subunit alcohol dehydrogenase family)
VNAYGALYVAFNNAGILSPTGRLLEQSEADWDRTIDVDLKGVFLTLKAEIVPMGTA